MQDVDNAWLANLDGAFQTFRRKAEAGAWEDGAVVHTGSVKWLRCYWNTHATKTYSGLPNGDSLTPGQVKLYYSLDGTAWVQLEAAGALPINGDDLVLYATNWAAAEWWMQGSFDYVIVMQRT